MNAQARPGYKLTEIGVIPEDWDVRPLSEIADPRRPIGYGIVQTGRLIVNGVKCIRVVDIDNGKVNEEDLITTSEAISSAYKRTILSEGDIVIALRGKIGAVAVIDSGLAGANLTRGIALLAPLKKHNSKYLCYYLSSPHGKQIFERNLNGSALQEIPIATLRKIPAVLPPPPEQRAIAAVLSGMDALISGLDQLIAKKRDIKQATMQQLLTGQHRLPGFLGDWEVKRLGDLASFLKGKGLPKSELTPYGADPCIHYGELFTLYPETIGEVISRTNGSRDAFRSVANDVLMPTSDVTPRGLAKASCVNADGVILGGDILVIRSDSKQIDGSFLSYVIRRNEDQVLQLVTGSTVFHLYGSDMKKFTFSMPSVPEQTAIVNILSDMESELIKLESRRQKTYQFKQGMMQELLTGRIRLL